MDKPAPETDTGLIQLLKLGDKAAANELISRYFSRVFRAAERRIGPSRVPVTSGDDIAASVFESPMRGQAVLKVLGLKAGQAVRPDDYQSVDPLAPEIVADCLKRRLRNPLRTFSPRLGTAKWQLQLKKLSANLATDDGDERCRVHKENNGVDQFRCGCK